VRALLDTDQIRIESCLSEADERSLANDVLDGLTRPFKELPPKHFYDARGSELFERICQLPEYYPTRTETAILRERADELVAGTGAGELVELGAGGSDKARTLLDAMARAGTLRRYVPLDVSEQVVRDGASRLVPNTRRCGSTAWSGTSNATLSGSPAPRTAPRGSWRCWAARSATSRPAPGADCCARSAPF
jgi:uncharacterized SAM-dependent methyltransferase